MRFIQTLSLAVMLLLQQPTFAMADFFAPDAPAESVEEKLPDQTEEARTSSTEEYFLTQKTLFTSSPEIDQVIGSKSGYIHPFISVGGYHTDNLFNTSKDEESDWVTVVSPGVWVALPASRQPLVEVMTLNSAPGGLEVGRFKTPTDRRLQAYALYRANINELNDNSDQDHVNQRAEAFLEYNMPGGLSLELLDIYEVDHDDYNSGDSGPTALDKYHANLHAPSISYRVGPKLSMRADYQLYTLDYNSKRNDEDDRDDNVYSFSISYKLTPKLSTFVQYEHVDTDYDVETRSDFTQDNYYGGVQWFATAKSRGRVKLGYGKNDYEQSQKDDNDEFLVETRIDHQFTPKSSMHIRAVRKTYTSNIAGTRDVLSQRVYLSYSQRFRPKWLARARFEYERKEYDGDITVGTVTDERNDNYFGFRAELGFALQRWLNLSAGYTLEKRDSNFDDNDYTSNIFFVYLTAAL